MRRLALVAALALGCALPRPAAPPPLRVGTSGDYQPFWIAHGDALDLEREARPALAALSLAIVDRAADLAADHPSAAERDPLRLAAALDPPLAPEAQRLAIAHALGKFLENQRLPGMGREEP